MLCHQTKFGCISDETLSNLFEVGKLSNQLKLMGELDRETTPFYTVAILATNNNVSIPESFGPESVQTVAITVNIPLKSHLRIY